jgi:diaminopimelate decarboxylase
MAEKILPFTKDQLETMIEQYGSPFHIYDELAIRENARKLIEAFSWALQSKQRLIHISLKPCVRKASERIAVQWQNLF